MKSFLQSHPTIAFAVILAGLQVVMLAVYFLNLDNGFDFTGHLVGRDFVNIYLGGGLIGQGQVDILFLPDRYWADLRSWLGPQYLVHNWSYPPTMFWPAEQLAKLPYYIAYLIWTFGGMLFLFLALRVFGLSWYWALLVIFSPAGIWNILVGQNAYYLAGLLIFAIHASHANIKLRAGFFWALATVKPHLGLLALPLLFGHRRYGVIVAGGAMFFLLIGIVYFSYGFEPWVQFFEVTVAQQRAVLESWVGLLLFMIPTAFMQGRLLGLPISAAYALHGIVAIATLWMLIRAWPGPKADKRHWLTWFALGTYLWLPYSFAYDFILFQVVLALWSKDLEALFGIKNKELCRGIWIFMWILPLICVAVASLLKVQIMPFALLWLLWKLGGKHFETGKLSEQG